MTEKNKPSKLFIIYFATRIVLMLSAPFLYTMLIEEHVFSIRIVIGVMALGILGFGAQAFIALYGRDKKFYIICNAVTHTFTISFFTFWGISELTKAINTISIVCMFIVALEIAWLIFLFKSKQIKDRFKEVNTI